MRVFWYYGPIFGAKNRVITLFRLAQQVCNFAFCNIPFAASQRKSGLCPQSKFGTPDGDTLRSALFPLLNIS
jgi:hypothetical protein